MKILSILVIMIFLFCSTAFCDTIYLKDGLEINGEIIGMEDDTVTIRTLEDTFKLDKSRIKKVEEDKEENQRIEDQRLTNPPGPQWDLKWD